jgi:biotin carboxyl carrier protein
VPTYAPYTVYSTGHAPAIAVQAPGQMQPHHDYQTAQRDGQTLEVRDLVLHRNGQSQSQQAIPSPIVGTVVSAGPMGNAGNAVVVRGDQGQLVYIFHMSSVDVRAGQRVDYGQDLGNQGSTGNSTGPHVHIEASSATIDRWVNDLLDGRFDGRRQ